MGTTIIPKLVASFWCDRLVFHCLFFAEEVSEDRERKRKRCKLFAGFPDDGLIFYTFKSFSQSVFLNFLFVGFYVGLSKKQVIWFIISKDLK
jgi:hypothetical protein